MSISSNKTTVDITVSAPGKMLLAGGYLVLEECNAGLVVAVDKRFYCRAQLVAVETITTQTTQITVISPQFDHSTWQYQYSAQNHKLTAVTTATASDSSHKNSNPYVEKALRVALLYLIDNNNSTATAYNIVLTIAADNDFYAIAPHLVARHLPHTLEAALSLPQRLPAAKKKKSDSSSDAYYKTGLGSSACLVTALTGALVHAMQQQQQDDDTTSSVIAKLAHIAHCYAQGKVGSGFDVSAAVHGSHVYRRFPKSLLSDLLVALDDTDNTTAADALKNVVHSEWSGCGGVVAPVHAFAGTKSFLQVIMADVAGGSESPSMAKTVLAWKQQQQQEQQSKSGAVVPHWDDLVTINAKIVQLLQQIHVATSTVDVDDMESLQLQFIACTDWSNINDTTNNNNLIGTLLTELQQAFTQARRHLKAMGEAAGVPIEPAPQTALCDATCKQIPGVVAALVPGAGGYDAVSCIYINHATVRSAIADFWVHWNSKEEQHGTSIPSSSSICPLTVQGADYGEGLRVEPEFPSVAADTTQP